MNKDGKLLTTRQSTTLIESKIFPAHPNSQIFTKALLQYKWLKPQLEAIYYHRYQMAIKKSKIENLKDAYIRSLQSVRQDRVILKKYYEMPVIIKNIKQSIHNRIQNDKYRPQILSQLCLRIKKKHQKQAEMVRIQRLKKKLEPEFIEKYRREVLNYGLPKKVKQSNKSPIIKNQKRSSKMKANRNLLGLKSVKSQPNEHLQNYGLKSGHSKKPSCHNLNSQQKEIQLKNLKINIKCTNNYTNFYLNQPQTHFAKSRTKTPNNLISTSRTTLSKYTMNFKSKMKTELSQGKSKEKQYKFSNKNIF